MNTENTVIPASPESIDGGRSSKQEDTDSTTNLETTTENINDFAEFALSPEVQKALSKLKFTKATPVQKACIPYLLDNDSDIVALAKTGTGKTAAFGLPLVEKLYPQNGLQALVLCPTRELAQQVALNLRNFAEFKKLKVTTVVGGESYDKQIRALSAKPEILVSTPGRLVDLMEQKIVNLQDVKYLVLDEADEMLSFGFQEALETIWDATSNQDLKTWLFSATMSKMIRNLAGKYLKSAHEVTLNTKAEKILVDSYACVIFEEDKEDALSLLIKNEPEFYGIIFATTKKQVAELEIKLRSLGLDVDSLHGDKVQAERTRTVERMKSRRTKILVATDVAARGLDIQDLTHVVNFEIPWDVETYTHRIGRTARAGKAGTVWTMVKPKESPKLARFEKALGLQFKNLRIPLVEEVQVAQKVKWIKEIAQRKMRETDLAKFEKAIAAIDNPELKLAELPADAKTWLIKAIDFFGQGEELRMKQPRALELRARGDYSSSDRGGDYERGSERRGGGGRSFGGRGGGGYSQRRDRSDRSDRGDERSSRGDGGGYRSNDRKSDGGSGSRWGFNKSSSGSGSSSRDGGSGSGDYSRGFRGGRSGSGGGGSRKFGGNRNRSAE
ncbi:MAG: DEAD/DEAH box helicase [Pseudobdellovibrio sp.]